MIGSVSYNSTDNIDMYLEGLASIVKVGSILSYCWMTIQKLHNLGKGKDEKASSTYGFNFYLHK